MKKEIESRILELKAFLDGNITEQERRSIENDIEVLHKFYKAMYID